MLFATTIHKLLVITLQLTLAKLSKDLPLFRSVQSKNHRKYAAPVSYMWVVKGRYLVQYSDIYRC